MAPGVVVTWDSDAFTDFEAPTSRTERRATLVAVGKLRDLGDRLSPPHMKPLQSEPGLLELRPRQGASPVRLISQGGLRLDGRRCAEAVREARRVIADNVKVIETRSASEEAELTTGTPLTKTFEAVLAAEFERDPAFRLEWERTALARAVAAQIIGYRSANGLSQRALAALLGVKQPFVARLESGETNPGLETLMNISRATGIEFVISISRATRAPRLVSRRVRESSVSEESNGVSLVFSAA